MGRLHGPWCKTPLKATSPTKQGLWPCDCDSCLKAIRLFSKTWFAEFASCLSFGTWPQNITHNLPCKVFIQESFFGPLGLHLLVWSDLGGLGIFDLWEILECSGFGPSVSWVKWPLRSSRTWCRTERLFCRARDQSTLSQIIFSSVKTNTLKACTLSMYWCKGRPPP